MKSKVPDARLGGIIALTKVQATKTFEFCAREASQVSQSTSISLVLLLFNFERERKEGKRGSFVYTLFHLIKFQVLGGNSCIRGVK